MEFTPRWPYCHEDVVASSITNRSDTRFRSQPSEYDLFNLPFSARPRSEARKECYPKSHNLNWVEYWQPSPKWTKIQAEKSRCGVEDSRQETWTKYRHNRRERIDVEARMEYVWFERPMLETKKPTATRSPWKRREILICRSWKATRMFFCFSPAKRALQCGCSSTWWYRIKSHNFQPDQSNQRRMMRPLDVDAYQTGQAHPWESPSEPYFPYLPTSPKGKRKYSIR